MELQISGNGLRKILKICYRNGFFSLQDSENSLKRIQYGALGSLFRRNIWREWLSSLINNTDVPVFPVELHAPKNQSRNELQLTKHCPYFQKVVFKHYFQALSSVGFETPCGFAAYGFGNHNVGNSAVLFDSPLLSKLESRSCLSIVFFSQIKKSSDWFNYWARYRFRWWRKFSSIPSKFSMSDVTETVTGHQQISLMMEFPWGKENLETITLHREDFFRSSCLTLGLDCMKETNSASSSVITCQSELDLASLAYLSNSFVEKWRDREVRKLFHLHVKLAPYKVCISVESENLEDLKNLKDVAKHLEKELKKCRVAVYPYFGSSSEKGLQFKQFDEMGIPYTIVLNKKALHSGIAGLRNRDTTLEEQIHIAELTPKLLKYLQIKSFEVDEC